MYTIKYKGRILHDPRTENHRVREAEFHITVGEAGEGSFLIDSTHPLIRELRRMSGIVELLSNGRPIFRGRILRDTADFNMSRKIETEGLLACLNDSIIPPFEYPAGVPGADTATNTVEYFLNWLLGMHNAQVSEEQQLLLGTVTVSDPNNYLARSSDSHATTMDTLRNKLTKSLGGYLLPRYEQDGTYLDYYAELPTTNTQSVRFGENLLDLVQEQDGSGIYTAILPIGKDKLTIADELDGQITPDLIKDGDIIYSVSGRELYGNITRIVEWNDVTQSGNLKNKAARQLALGVGTQSTITCQAVDLGFTDAEVAEFRVGRNTLVYSSPHGLSAAFPLMEMTVLVDNPAETEITLGGTSVTFTGNTVAGNQDLAESMANIVVDFDTTELEASIDGKLSSLSQTTQTNITKAVADSEKIIMQAMESYTLTGDFETYKTTVTTQLQQMSDNLMISINSNTQTINNNKNTVDEQFENFNKYFRFDAEGLWIGEVGNEVLLRLDNDSIQFIRNNLAELWLDPAGMHADNIEIRRIQAGNFEIVGEPDGRLSIRKAVN